ncbi:MAG: hypothetical protein L6V91_00930 [Bacilli bacterium]|nr:MAG: hypothetical protein L6V91_00930 [Bacilli bacterium]
MNRLYCPYNIKEEIMNNPDKYYMEPPTEEDKKRNKKINLKLKTIGFNFFH